MTLAQQLEKKGLEQGLEQGLKQGLEKFLEQGRKEGERTFALAKKLLEFGSSRNTLEIFSQLAHEEVACSRVIAIAKNLLADGMSPGAVQIITDLSEKDVMELVAYDPISAQNKKGLEQSQ